MTFDQEQYRALQRRVAELQEEIGRRREAEERERAARQRAEAAVREHDDFLRRLAHELRTPLNAVAGWAHLLRMLPADPARLADGLEAIDRNARLQARLIEDLINTSDVRSGSLRLEFDPVHLPQIVTASLDAMRPLAAEAQVDITSEVDSLGGTVLGDAERIHQILVNVLAHVIETSTEGGKIDVSLSRDDVRAEIRIIDNGLGFDPAAAGRLFERAQLPAGSTAHPRLQFGLAIARRLAELHGGSLDATSRGIGEGSTFTLRLPLLPLGVEETDTRGRPQIPQLCTGLRVLVVDDDDDARALVAEVLAHHGAVVDVAESTLLAMAALTRSRYDILVSDLSMPHDDGFMLIEQLRQEPGQNCDIPAVALTAHASEDVRERALAAGFAAYVTKPVTPAALVNVVAGVARTRS